MKIFLLISIFTASLGHAEDKKGGLGMMGHVPGVNTGLGLGYRTGFGMLPVDGYGLSPESLAKFFQIQKMNQALYDSATKESKRQDEQRKNTDQLLQADMAEAQTKVSWEIANRKCSNQLQALADFTRPITGSKEFIYNSNSLTISDGKKTLIYSKNGLTTVDDQCNKESKKSLRDGLKMVFESTLPEKAPRAGIEKDPSVAHDHKERMKAHLETLKSCESALGTEYVQEMASKYQMVSPQASRVKESNSAGAQ